MKVKSKQLLFSSLPNARKGKKLPKYQMGKRMGETGAPAITLDSMPNDYFKKLEQSLQQPPAPTQMNAFDNIQGVTPFQPTASKVDPITWDPLSGETPKRPTTQSQPQQPAASLRKGMNPGQAALLGLTAFDAVLPDWYPKYTPAQPQMGYNPNLYGTGSQAIARAGDSIPNAQAGTRMKSDSGKEGSRRGSDWQEWEGYNNRKIRPTIYTPDPNDSRIQKYRDSLTLYNTSRNLRREADSYNRPLTPDEFQKLSDKYNPPAVYEAYNRLGNPEPVNFSIIPIDNSKTPGYEKQADSVNYARPVQPVEYRNPRRPVVSSDVQTVAPYGGSANVQGMGLRPADLSQKPTKYSVTVRDENAPGKQRSIYFKDKKSWRDFMDAGAVSPISSSEMEDSATAAGYRSMQQGGPITIYQPKDTKLIKLDDTRSINPATGKPFKNKSAKSISATDQNIKTIVAHAKAQGVDPYNALAIAMQESELGNIDSNYGHVTGDDYLTKLALKYPKLLGETDITAALLASALSDKAAYAKTLAGKGVIPDSEEYMFQTYNGLGKLTPDTEARYHGGRQKAFYEIPVSNEQPLDLKKNPAYGKTVLSLRDQVLKKNKDIQQLVDTTEAFKYEEGGQIPTAEGGKWIQKAINPEHKGYCTPMTKKTCTPKRKALAKTLKKMAKNRKGKDGMSLSDDDLLEQLLIYNSGGSVNTTGYRDGSPTAGNDFNIIPGGNISMQGVSQPIMARPINEGLIGMEQVMLPGQEHNFEADAVLEYPMARAGLSAAKAKEMLRDGTANGKKLTKKQKRYFGMVAAGKAQGGTQVATTEPVPPTLSGQERYYQASARLGHFKGILNEKLKAKNPQGFGDYFKGLVDLRRSGNTGGAEKYVQDTPYEDYLTPEEVQSTLSPEDYNDYVTALQDVNSYNIQQGRQPLYGTKENAGDVRALNYGRRFASLQLTPSLGISNKEGTRSYSRDYKYDPKTRQVTFNEMGDIGLRPSYLSATPAPMAGATASLRKGGVVYDDGGQIGTMWGGDSKLASYNPYDGGTVEFQGASHDNGGIGMHYNGTPVEVEGGEFAAQDSAGNLNIFGNMYLPGTRTKFKRVAKEIAKKEKDYDRLKTNGSRYVNEANPANKFEKLKFNSGMVMMQGGELGQRDLAQKKENLSALQKAMLDTADEFGLDAEKLSAGKMVKAKKGKQVKKKSYYQAGGAVNDPTMADRNNNPGNIKWGKFAKKMGAKKGPPALDGGNFAIFPNRAQGDKAMRELLKSPTYKNLTVEDAISKWTGGHPYKYDLSPIGGPGKKVADLDDEEFEAVMDTMKVGEGTRYGPGVRTPGAPAAPPAPTFTPYGLPDVPGFTADPRRPRPGTVEPPFDALNPPPDPGPIPSNVEPLHINQLLGEIYGAATNSVEPVPTQRYEPQLFQPYQVSFQDRLNLNQNSFNALRRAVGPTNPSALGELAAQKYAADSGVKADEFRTNQAIANDVTNKNVALLNDANLKNLALADTQMVRQSQARSNTRAQDQLIINSLSSKFMQNRYENKRLAAYENLYDYRFVDQEDGGLKATYYGPNAAFNFSGNRGSGQAPDVRTVTRYDAQGNVKGYTEYDDFDLREMQRALDLEMKRRNMPLMTVPPLNKK